MVMQEFKKRGRDNWDELIGKTISFRWYDGFDETPYYFKGVFQGIRVVEDTFPKYFILLDGGGPSVWADEEVIGRIEEH